MSYISGRQFVQLPGPTNVPERVLRAMSRPTIDHRGPEFGRLGIEVLEGIKEIFQTSGKVVIFPCWGSGAWKGQLTNMLLLDKILMFEVGQFAALWIQVAQKLGLNVDVVHTDVMKGRGSASGRGEAERRSQPADQGCVCGAERDFVGSDQFDRCGSRRDRPSEASGAAASGCHFFARVD